jgi:hypothetical protein
LGQKALEKRIRIGILCGICVAAVAVLGNWNAYAIGFPPCVQNGSCESGVAQMLGGVGNELDRRGTMGCRFRGCNVNAKFRIQNSKKGIAIRATPTQAIANQFKIQNSKFKKGLAIANQFKIPKGRGAMV